MNAPTRDLWEGTIEDIARILGDGTCQALELQRPIKPACPMCGMTGWHRDSCPTQEKHS